MVDIPWHWSDKIFHKDSIEDTIYSQPKLPFEFLRVFLWIFSRGSECEVVRTFFFPLWTLRVAYMMDDDYKWTWANHNVWRMSCYLGSSKLTKYLSSRMWLKMRMYHRYRTSSCSLMLSSSWLSTYFERVDFLWIRLTITFSLFIWFKLRRFISREWIGQVCMWINVQLTP